CQPARGSTAREVRYPMTHSHQIVLALVTHSFCFSSRRRHTRSKRDWSSDVCSSDLSLPAVRGRRRCSWPAAARLRSAHPEEDEEIGRASCRERVEMQEGAIAEKKKKRMKRHEQWKKTRKRTAREERDGEKPRGMAQL